MFDCRALSSMPPYGENHRGSSSFSIVARECILQPSTGAVDSSLGLKVPKLPVCSEIVQCQYRNRVLRCQTNGTVFISTDSEP
jgi:hypothetical protein